MPPDVEVTATLEVVIDPRAMAAWVRTYGSTAFRAIVQAGQEVKNEAIRLAPVSKPDPIPRRVPVRPGRLRDSIVARVGTDSSGAFVRVGANTEYATYVHEGTVPHRITARRAPRLVFWHGGRVVYARTVNHPGNAPNRYLTKAATRVLGSRNVRTV